MGLVTDRYGQTDGECHCYSYPSYTCGPAKSIGMLQGRCGTREISAWQATVTEWKEIGHECAMNAVLASAAAANWRHCRSIGWFKWCSSMVGVLIGTSWQAGLGQAAVTVHCGQAVRIDRKCPAWSSGHRRPACRTYRWCWAPPAGVNGGACSECNTQHKNPVKLGVSNSNYLAAGKTLTEAICFTSESSSSF